MSRRTVSAVLPVRGAGGLLDDCLDAMRAQGQALDEIVLVDDSPDASLAPIPGVRMVRSGGVGPYAARNIGWRSSMSDVVVFLDMRSRPRPGWAAAMTAPFEDDTVAIVGSEVLVTPGSSLAATAAHDQQFFQLRNYLANPFFLPYLPTCNLAVRRSDLEAVDGFSEVRSGGDADLCWKILSRPGRRLDALPEVLMDWLPRVTSRDYLEQNYRYGRSHHALRVRWSDAGCPMKAPTGRTRLAKRLVFTWTRFALAQRRGDPERAAQLLRHASSVVFDIGYRSAADAHTIARLRSAQAADEGAGGS